MGLFPRCVITCLYVCIVCPLGYLKNHTSKFPVLIQEELTTVCRLLEQCEKDRETEVIRRQHTDERLLQALEANRLLTTQVESGRDSAAAQLQVNLIL